jgi:hypothetical protein
LAISAILDPVISTQGPPSKSRLAALITRLRGTLAAVQCPDCIQLLKGAQELRAAKIEFSIGSAL